MPSPSVTASGLSNSGGVDRYTESAATYTISEVFRGKYPSKTWAFIANLLGLQERAAKHRLAASRPYTVAELQIILQSEDGFDFLNALMEDAQPKWWWWAKRVIATAERRRLAAEIDQEILQLETSRPSDVNGRRRIKGDLDARTTLGKKFAAAETALGFLAPNPDRAASGAMVPAQAAGPAKRPYAGRGR